MNKLSNEELIKYAEEKIDKLTLSAQFKKPKYWEIEEIQLAQIALDALRELKCDQVPVAVVDIQHGRADGNLFAVTLTKAGHALKDDVYELFTAPQKPVVPMAVDDGIIRDANRYRFLRDEDSWGEDSDNWDPDTRTGLISSDNLMGGLSPEHFDDAIDARMAASDIPFLNAATAPQKPVGLRQIGSIDHDGGEFAEYFVEFTDSAQVVQAVYVIDSAIEDAGGVVKDGD